MVSWMKGLMNSSKQVVTLNVKRGIAFNRNNHNARAFFELTRDWGLSWGVINETRDNTLLTLGVSRHVNYFFLFQPVGSKVVTMRSSIDYFRSQGPSRHDYIDHFNHGAYSPGTALVRERRTSQRVAEIQKILFLAERRIDFSVAFSKNSILGFCHLSIKLDPLNPKMAFIW